MLIRLCNVLYDSCGFQAVFFCQIREFAKLSAAKKSHLPSKLINEALELCGALLIREDRLLVLLSFAHVNHCHLKIEF